MDAKKKKRPKKIDAWEHCSPEVKAALQGQRGGWRPNSGRPAKGDKSEWGQITCVLKKSTILQLRAGAASKHFGDYLQFHLDRYPPPDRETYLALVERTPIIVEIKPGRRVPVLISAGNSAPVRVPRRRRSLSKREYEHAILSANDNS